MEQSKFTIISRQVVPKTLRCGISYSVTSRLIKEGNRWIAEFKYKFESSTVSEFLSRARLGKNTFVGESVVAGGNVELHQNVRVTRNILCGDEILAQASP